MSNTTTSSDQFWGDLRSLMHASHIDFDTLTQLTAEFLEHASDELRASAQRYIEDGFKRRQNRDAITQEFSAHAAPSCFGQESGRTVDFLDEGMTLSTDYYDDEEDWEDEYARYEAREEREWALYEVIDTHEGATPERLLADLEVGGGARFITHCDEDGALLHVTCHVPEEFCGQTTWFDLDDIYLHTHSVHISFEHDLQELCFD